MGFKTSCKIKSDAYNCHKLNKSNKSSNSLKEYSTYSEGLHFDVVVVWKIEPRK